MIESDVLSWNSKVAMPFWLKSKAFTWATPEGASSTHSRYLQVYARGRPGRRTIAVVLPGTFTETHFVESLFHITARALLIVYQKRYWGLIGNYLKEVVGVVNPHLARVSRPSAATVE